MSLAFDVPFAGGHRARTTCGLVAAGMSGIRSILEEWALPVFTSGSQHNACHVAAGRRVAIDICTEVFWVSGERPARIPTNSH